MFLSLSAANNTHWKKQLHKCPCPRAFIYLCCLPFRSKELSSSVSPLQTTTFIMLTSFTSSSSAFTLALVRVIAKALRSLLHSSFVWWRTGMLEIYTFKGCQKVEICSRNMLAVGRIVKSGAKSWAIVGEGLLKWPLCLLKSPVMVPCLGAARESGWNCGCLSLNSSQLCCFLSL